MIPQNLLLFIFVFLFLKTCFCTSPHICSPSSCGNIHNISFPFRLKHDPKECGDPRYELSCENNITTILHLMNSPQKYKVKAINYHNSTITVADASVNNNTCSFPSVSLNRYLLHDSPYITWNYNSSGDFNEIALPVSFMRCPYPLNNSSSLFFTQVPTHCNTNSPTIHTYIKVGHMNASYVGENCTLDLIVLTSWKFKDSKNVSFSEIHDSLLYGFELSLSYQVCTPCNGGWKCALNEGDTLTCSHSLGAILEALWDNMKHTSYAPDGLGPTALVILILVLILGVNLPAKIIVGITCASVFIIVEMKERNRDWYVSHFRLIIGLFFAIRLVILFPCTMWLLIYKFRRRHLSRFAAIEDFLQSENNHIMPIRYSYSDIKKMTRGFREKLGQGGYGTVYKGKLRSGYDVAIKLLTKPGGNDQDFMNEIATIGRIHHVNVVNLVGYCADRSKRALVFDFMPNGSLDKYIFGREKMISLTWERKYEIAVGISRGIAYLHKGCAIQILHFDIKPHNILLDDNFTPKITDFGLAKFYSTDKKMVTMTAVRGTIGYVAPELIIRSIGGVSYKADVYSFGMLLMEMVGLNRDLKVNNQASSQYFPCWIYDCFEKGQDIEFGVAEENNNDDNNDTIKKIAKKMTIVALWCIQMSPDDRPSMNKVVEMLEGQVERLRVPNRPPQSAQVAVNYEDHSWTTYSTDSISLLGHDAAPSVEITVDD